MTGPSRLWRDEDHDRVPLGQLERLCAVLDLRPAELFVSRRKANSGVRLDPNVIADAATVEAALATLAAARSAHQHLPTGGPIARADLAAALGWTLTRFDNALHTLDERLAGSGTRLDLDPDGAVHGLRPRDGLLSIDQRERLHRLRAADLILSRPAAQALYAIAVHGYRLYGEDTQGEAAPAIELQQRGLAQRRRNTTDLDPSPEVRAALLLADPPAPSCPPSVERRSSDSARPRVKWQFCLRSDRLSGRDADRRVAGTELGSAVLGVRLSNGGARLLTTLRS